MIAMFRRRKDPLGRAALYLTIAHAVDALAGIYWVAGTGTLPWLVVGLAAGIDREVTEPPDPPYDRQPVVTRSTMRSTSAADGAPSHSTVASGPASATSVTPTSISQR